MNTLTQLEILMSNQRRAIRWYVSFATVLVSSGVILVVVTLLSGARLTPEPVKTVLGIAGGLISTVSVFPLKEVNGCRDRVTIYERLRKELGSCPASERERIEGLVWDVVKKVALG